jgi:thiamine kinase-like enzyme
MAYNLTDGWAVLPYRDCPTLLEQNLAIDIKVTKCAETLHRVHQQPLEFDKFDLHSEVTNYIQMLDSIERQTYWLNKMATLPALPEVDYYSDSSMLQPCHMDLSFANILSNDEVLDWEYARQALPIVDIAACATINQLNRQQSEALLQHYNQLSGYDYQADELFVYCAWCDFLNELWYQIAESSPDALMRLE